MKKIYYSFVFLFAGMLIYCNHSNAQTDVSYTLNFIADDAGNWADGIAQDGDGGATDIPGFTLQIYTAGPDHTTLYKYADNTASTIEWWDNSYYFSTDDSYSGITSGPSTPATNNGVPAMVMKSADNSQNFSLTSMKLYDWGYTNVITIETYDNGVKKGSVDFTPDPSYTPTEVSQSDLLTPSVFTNIDEVRFFPKSFSIFNLSLNNIQLKLAGTLPVTFTSITATRQDRHIKVQWKVENETGIEKYELQRSSDGKSFQTLTTKDAINGAIPGASYDWTDLNPLPGNNFYRVKSFDRSGVEKFSTIVKAISGKELASLSVYPNPSTGGLAYLQLNHFSAGTYQLQLINSEGKVVLGKDVSIPSGNSSQSVDLSRFPKGVYLIRLTMPGQKTFEKTIIR
jgi:hypothetical protein